MLVMTYRTKAILHLFSAEDARAIALADQALSIAQQLEETSVIGSAYGWPWHLLARGRCNAGL